MSKLIINVTTTRAETNEFSEAEHYDEFVAQRLAQIYSGADVSVDYGQTTRAHVYADGAPDTDIADEVAGLVRVDLWDEFCAEGYKSYSAAGTEVR